MPDARLPVKDLPKPLRDAAVNRGYDPTHEMTAREALGEYTAWNMGDAAWGWSMFDYIVEFNDCLKRYT